MKAVQAEDKSQLHNKLAFERAKGKALEVKATKVAKVAQLAVARAEQAEEMLKAFEELKVCLFFVACGEITLGLKADVMRDEEKARSEKTEAEMRLEQVRLLAGVIVVGGVVVVVGILTRLCRRARRWARQGASSSRCAPKWSAPWARRRCARPRRCGRPRWL